MGFIAAPAFFNRQIPREIFCGQVSSVHYSDVANNFLPFNHEANTERLGSNVGPLKNLSIANLVLADSGESNSKASNKRGRNGSNERGNKGQVKYILSELDENVITNAIRMTIIFCAVGGVLAYLKISGKA